MRKIFRIIAISLCVIFILGTAAGCGSKSEKITVLCTVFPIYDWVRSVVGESETVEVKLLVSNGADLHSFQPTAKDAITIGTADLVIRVGGIDDSFVNELVKNGSGIDLRLIEAEGVSVRESAHSSEHSHGDGHDHPTDEHIWLSLKNAVACVRAICSTLAEVDPVGAEGYRERAESYIEELSTLDSQYAAVFSEADEPKMVFADRFPFVYMTSDYGIEYEAAFEGCSTDAEAGFDTVLRLSDRLDEWRCNRLFITETSDGRLADTLCGLKKDRPIEVHILNSLQSVNSEDIAKGVSYLEIMRENLAVLSTAFGSKETK